jgi:tetratricopeptide (TPR) repeat protein
MVQNFRLVWLDGSIDEINNADCRNSITKLRQIVNTVNTFTDVDECIDFINDIKEEKVFMISSGALGQTTIPVVHDKPQVSVIYIFGGNKSRYQKWAKEWRKVQGVYKDITSICEVLKQAAQDCDQNSVSISFVKSTDGSSNQNLNQLDQSFMYTQILKEILLTIDFEQIHTNEFLTYCREQFVGNTTELDNVDKIEKEYRHHQPIWWYTYECFLYSMLNRALRTMEVDLIIKMGFFVRDLHNHIAELHTEQYGGQNHLDSFTVYRGQGLSQTYFDQLKKTQGGLLSFNNFLSTSKNRNVSLDFAQRTMATSSLVGVIFVINIDPSISATPFANVGNVGYYPGEEEILFSMHSVFRIGQVKQIDKNDRLWQVDLTLTSENDPQLHTLTKCMQEETAESTGWLRLGRLMIKLSHFDKAEELYEILLKQTTYEVEKANLFHHLGAVKDEHGKYAEAIEFYEKSLEINQKILPTNNPHSASTYSNIGLVYDNMGEYSKALSYHEKALEIRQKVLPENHPDLATSYACLGFVYKNMGEYSKALSYYEKDLEISQKIFPENHPHLATSYNNIGLVYDNMGEYSKALSYYEKALKIRQKTLPENHLDLASSYVCHGLVYDHMGKYSKALSFHEKALEIRQKTLPANHPHVASSYSNIGDVYYNMGEYSKALSCYEKTLKIRQKTLAVNHPDVASSYNNIGGMYDHMGEHSKALSYYEKALKIRQKILPENDSDLAISYHNIGNAYYNLGEYSKALSYYEKALEIWQKTLSANHDHLATSYNNIGQVYNNMGEYSKALSYYEKALEIRQKTLPENHLDLAGSYNNIGFVYNGMGEYSKALSYSKRALGIWERSLSPNHPYIQAVRKRIQMVKKKL